MIDDSVDNEGSETLEATERADASVRVDVARDSWGRLRVPAGRIELLSSVRAPPVFAPGTCSYIDPEGSGLEKAS